MRNKIRRRVFEAVQGQWPDIKPSYDIAITVFDEKVAHEPFKNLENTITSLLKQADLYK